jgi:hypothetical protein
MRRYLLACAALALAAAGCGSSASSAPQARPDASPADHPATARAAPGLVTERLARGRFTVTFTAQALEMASAGGASLPQVVAHALARINALLPGPPTAITVLYTGSAVIPQTGTYGLTNADGRITIGFLPTAQASLGTIMTLWLPRTLSHEVDHSVRFLAGPGYGPSLLEQIISEGISSAFDTAAFPGTADPWDRAISPGQECALWKQARPLLSQTGLYDQWFLGGGGIPNWAGFTIGYDIVTSYRQRHPDASWPAITTARAATILAGSGYQPCSS